MIRGLLTFGLTRRPLVLLGLLVFLGAGLFAFSKLNIEAYPNPAPVILEITAQAPGLSAEEMERQVLLLREKIRYLQVIAMRPGHSAEDLERLRWLERAARAQVKRRASEIAFVKDMVA